MKIVFQQFNTIPLAIIFNRRNRMGFSGKLRIVTCTTKVRYASK